MQSRGLSRVFSSTTVQKHQFFSLVALWLQLNRQSPFAKHTRRVLPLVTISIAQASNTAKWAKFCSTLVGVSTKQTFDTLPQTPAVTAENLFVVPCVHAKSLQLCRILSDPMDCSLPGSSIRGIFYARVLEWGADTFSDDKPRQCIKKQRHYFVNKDPSSQGYGFSSSRVWM